MTQPERELWIALRAKRFDGVKFARQVVIGPYIADFVARSHKLIIEIDGDTHSDRARDDQRTAWLERQDYRVIRFDNGDVMSNLESMLLAISDALLAIPSPNPLPNGERAINAHHLKPSPRRGEGLGEGQPQTLHPE